MSEKNGDKGRTRDPGNLIAGIIDIFEEFIEGKHIFLPTRAYISLYLGMYTFFILYFVANVSLASSLRSYAWSFLFLGYFLLHYLWEVKGPKSIRDIEKIKAGQVAHTEIAKIIRENATKNPEAVMEFVNNRISKKMFTEDIQLALFEQYDKISADLVEYIQKKLLEVEFFPRAIGEFLSVTTGSPLDEDFLKGLIEKYGHKGSFWFNLGRYHQYYTDLDKEVKGRKYFSAGYNFSKIKLIEKILIELQNLIFIFAMVSIAMLLIFGLAFPTKQDIISIFLILLILCIPIQYLLRLVYRHALESKLVDSLKKANIELGEYELDRVKKHLGI